MIVMKFGGTSVGSPERIRSAVDRVSERLELQPLVVVSALSGVTDLLIGGARSALHRDGRVDGIVRGLHERHSAFVHELLPSGDLREAVLARIDGVLEELKGYYAGIHHLQELTPRSLDAVAGMGERMSSEVVAAVLLSRGLPARAVDARDVIVTDDSYTRAMPLLAETGEALRRTVLPLMESRVTPVLPGFIGRTPEGVTTTLGRGGSDYSASIVGALLPASEIQIWTDVDGMMTADPRIVSGARVLPEVSFEEAAELAYFGAKVLHPATIKPAVERGIPVRILNSLNPASSGTLITAGTGAPSGRPQAIAFKKGITIVLISQPRMLMAYGFVARAFQVFERHKTPVDLIATSEVSISLTVDEPERLPAIEKDLAPLGDVRLFPGMAIVCIVGRGFMEKSGLAGRIFGSLKDVNVAMISFGASEVNLSCVVHEADAERAARLLHREFFEDGA